MEENKDTVSFSPDELESAELKSSEDFLTELIEGLRARETQAGTLEAEAELVSESDLVIPEEAPAAEEVLEASAAPAAEEIPDVPEAPAAETSEAPEAPVQETAEMAEVVTAEPEPPVQQEAPVQEEPTVPKAAEAPEVPVQETAKAAVSYGLSHSDYSQYEQYRSGASEAGRTGRSSGYNYSSGTVSGNRSAYSGASGSRSSEGGSVQKQDLKRYVTKKGLAIAMVFTMLVSSAIGAAVGVLAARQTAAENASAMQQLSQSQQMLEAATGSNKTIEEIVKENEDSVVEINTLVTTMSMWGSTEGEAAGSGVIVRENGYIVTNNHVIEGAHAITVTLHNGEEYSAQIVGTDQQNDLAVLKIDGDDFDAVTFGNSDELSVGDLTVAIGNPLGQLGGTATSGIISALDRKLELDGRELNLLQTDSAINPGNSGGGLFNDNGELIGIVVAKSSGTGIEGLGFAIPINTAAPIIDDLIENGKISNRPAAGIKIYEVSEDRTEYYGKEKPGIYIGEVNGTNAKKAGLREDDRIVAFEGVEVESSSAVVAAIQEHKIGDEVTFTVERDGELLDITFALENSANFS
ncbi:MAG: trypsin-like peptidase domain-containing protein [Mogibacterium sp.]|nr:trypsin-like peptidase domain-containing protein [Mogibacterium sp.]